jgi:hypothetical protein
MNQQSEHIIITINEVPHNGKSITKIAVSPQSKYIVTYSQEDKSFVGWRINDDDNQEGWSFKNLVRWFTNNDEDTQEDESFIGCTRSLFIKNNPKYKSLFKSFVGFIKWVIYGIEVNQSYDSGPLIFDDKVQPYKLLDLEIFDFKLSDKKIIIYEGNNGLGKLY